MDVRTPFFQNIACVLIGVLFLNPIVATAAELALDAQAGGNAALAQAGNGVPIVNISTPNGSGLSHNKFTEFNVGQQGLILNNSAQGLVQTQLGGYVVGNPNLKAGAANVILNEVNGGNPSQLKGYTEVAGKSAAVIVANPHGISCDGCGFINTPRVTLSTGKPIVENGRVDRFDVDGGQISIEGAGLNAGNIDQFDLITRSAKINAELYAKQLNVIAGRNQVDADTLNATAKADDGSSQPQLAIDSSALGGMYAGAIRLVGTEAGVGVKLAGNMAASAGDIQIDANGQLSLAQAVASRDMAIKAETVTLNADTYAGRDARIETGSLSVAQSLASGGKLKVTADQLDNHGVLEAGAKADGSLNSEASLELLGGAVNNRGQVVSHGTLSTDLQSLDNAGSTLVSAGAASLKAQSLNNAGGTLIGQQALTLRGGELNNQAGTIASNQTLDIALDETLDNSADGLLLSKAGGLVVDAKQLLNQSGTVQADDGNLSVLAETVANQKGRITTGNGALTLTAGELNNQAGEVIAEGGALTISGATLDNTEGRVQAESLKITATQRLNNAQGSLVATEGEQAITAGQVDNQAGRISAKSNLQVTAVSLDNNAGMLGGNHIALDLDGALSNTDGLVESTTTLDLQAGSLSNANGKLRALSGAAGSQSTFGIDGQFNNDNGLVEIGNSAFSLTSQGLSNQGGTVHHVGDQGFNLALADVGQAGGSFITNGALHLNVADWINSSLLQAQKLTLDIGTFAQAASGKLISAESIVANGGTWHNDGSIETDGELSLNLTGAYTGAGKLLSQSTLTFAADSARMDAGAEVRSGGDATVTVAGALSNAGTLTAAGDIEFKAAALTNLDTLGATGSLLLQTSTLRNEGGLIFSGGDMQLLGNSHTNLKGDIYSLGTLTVAKNSANERAALLENISGTIESAGDMRIFAGSVVNRKDKYDVTERKVSGEIRYSCSNCEGSHYDLWYYITEIYERYAVSDSAAAALVSGGVLDIEGTSFVNSNSTVSAVDDISIVVDEFTNEGTDLEIVTHSMRYKNPADSESGSVFIGLISPGGGVYEYNKYNAEYIPRYTDNNGEYYYKRINEVTTELNPYFDVSKGVKIPAKILSYGAWSSTQTAVSSGNASPAIIQSGKNVSITAANELGNGVRKINTPIDQGYSLAQTVEAPSSGLIYLVNLNTQLPADLSQQSVNPLTLPGFNLPQGQNGLFHYNSDPKHPYLVETNPVFTSLKSFLGSDYMLDKLGYSADGTQRRLGDGLYEQRLIRDAIVARTGKRFLADALVSDEAQFRYLMENAIASKEALNLSVGIALSAEQVAALTHDIVWMQEQEVGGEKVLVPVLYLAQANDRLGPNGALIQGQNLALISGGGLKNQGTLRASSDLTATATNMANSGLMQANERISLLASDSIRNAQGGIIAGKDVSAMALLGDVSNERTVSRYQDSKGNWRWTQDFIDSAARIEASDSLALSAGRDITNIGSVLESGGDIDLDAGQDVVIAAAQQESGIGDGKDRKHSRTTQHESQVSAGNDLNIDAERDVALIGSQMAAEKDMVISAGADVLLAAAADEHHSYSKSDDTTRQEDHVKQKETRLQVGNDLYIEAARDLTLIASKADVGREAYLVAGDRLSMLSAQNYDYSLYDMKKEGSWGSKETQRDEVTTVRNIGSSITTGGNLTLISEGDQLYQKAHLESGGDLTLDSGGSITFEAVKDLDQESHEKSDDNAFWTSMEGKGTTDETLRQSVLLAQGEVVIKAVDGLKIDIKQVNKQSVSHTIDAMVQADPQLAWLKEAELRGDVDWRQVKEIHESFKYEHSGLGPASQLIIAIALSVIIGPMAGGLGGTVTQAVTVSVATKATVSTINNRGDLGAVAKDVTSSDSMKGYVVAGVTAGVAHGMGYNPTNFTAKEVALKITADAVVKTAAYGGSFKDNLAEAALGNAISIGGALGANEIGDLKLAEGGLSKIALHAALGGLMAEAMGGDFRTGALAAGANEALVGFLGDKLLPKGVDKNSPEYIQATKNLLAASQIVGVLASVVADGDVNIGAAVAANATQYNYLNHSDARDFVTEMEACQGDGSCQDKAWKQFGYDELSLENLDNALKVGGVVLARDYMGNIAAGLDALTALNCTTSVCETHKLTLMERAFIAYERASDVAGEFEPALAMWTMGAGAGRLPVRAPGSKQAVGSASVQKAVDYFAAAKGPKGSGAVVDDLAIAGKPSGGSTSSVLPVSNNSGVGGFKVGLGADDIVSINSKFGGSISFREVDTVIANAANYDGFYNKAGSMIRDIAGGHLFDNGNKRTAVEVVEQLIIKNGVDGPPRQVIWNVVDKVATGKLNSVQDISKALRGLD
jgi:filamentous hemagglutinin